MAVVYYWGLLGSKNSATVTLNTTTFNSLISTISINEGLSSSYYRASLYQNPSVNSIVSSSTNFTALGIVDGDTILCSPIQTGDKESRQRQKLEIAAATRAADGRRSVYDINELPTKYVGNTATNNSNPNGLLIGRPWVDISRVGLQLYLDPASTASYPGSGISIKDLSVNAYTGVLTNGVGYSNYALTFDGNNDYIDMNQSITSTNFTVMSWFKCSNDTTVPRMIVSKETTAGGPWNYRIWLSNGTVNGDIASAPSSGQGVQTATNCADNQWHMAVFVRDTTAGKLYLYVDNVLKTQATETLVNPQLVPNNQEVWFGRSAFTAGGTNPTGSYPYIGSLGEQMIYSRAMTSDEIDIIYRATRSRYGV